MKKVITRTIPLFLLLITLLTNAQTFFTEDFDSYPAGPLNTVYDNTTPGQGGWLVSRSPNFLLTPMITAEAGKGNVLTITTTSPTQEGLTFRQANDFLTTLWNNRTPGNNIIKFEYEFYGEGSFVFYGNLMNYFVTKPSVINTAFQSTTILTRILGNYLENSSSYKIHVLKNYNATTFPYNTWIKAEMFVDYNTKNVYFHIPTLNLQATGTFNHNTIPTYIDFGAGSLDATSVVKIDNIKVSGLKTLPSYILSVNQQLATKFNLYPNPATNVVNITNAENMQVNQITVYNLAGKQVSTQAYNNLTEMQLNVAHLASGTYLLYLQTAQGTAVKQFIKK